MVSLSDVTCPDDLRHLTGPELNDLADQIRHFLIEKVSATGGHLGPNLGVVELTLAVHRVFDSPDDPIIFDTGHISYVHKILTGRQGGFDDLRSAGGMSGYPSRAESPHDWVENSHASAALSWGAGMAEGFRLTGDPHTVVVVVGDGALTGGMAWEALNNIAVHKDLHMVIIVNDNGRSYTSTVGGLAQHLTAFRTDRRYDQTLDIIKGVVQKTPLVGKPAYDLLHGLKAGLKDILAPQQMFSDLELKYIGPVDGHDITMLERALVQAKEYSRPVIVHAVTQKGRGFSAAESDEEDHFHAIGIIDPVTGEPLTCANGPSWTSVFSDEMVKIGRNDPQLVAISAAMVHPVGLAAFEEAFPARVFDVGIAEQHAVTSAAGLAMVGLHPVVAVYSTFLTRATDQVLMDVGLHKMPVTFVLDRAGVTGPDGPSHHGIWDMALLTMVPGMRIGTPRDEKTLRGLMAEAIADQSGPTCIRFPKGEICPATPASRSVGGVDILVDEDSPQVSLIGYGPMAGLAMEVAEDLRETGIKTRVVDPVWAWPISESLISLIRDCHVIVTIEDGVDGGGLGQKLSAQLLDEGCDAKVIRVAVPTAFIPQGSRRQILTDLGFTREDVARRVRSALSDL